MTLGTYHVFTTNSGDALPNPLLYDPTGRVLVAHPTLATDAQCQVGTADCQSAAGDTTKRDLRFLQKTIPLAAARVFNGLNSQFALNVYPVNTSPISIIRNEDLILLRAEARYFTADAAGALADINVVRTTSGNLAPLAGFANAAAFTSELLYNRRYSLLFEGGHRWVDLHRFGLLNTLPVDRATDHVFSAWPLPSDECNNRSPQPAGCTQPLSAAQTIK
jgi:hypothetical protein